jgi:hypothetical protein
MFGNSKARVATTTLSWNCAHESRSFQTGQSPYVIEQMGEELLSLQWLAVFVIRQTQVLRFRVAGAHLV